MKKLVLTIAFILPVLLSYSQKLGKSKLPLEDLMKMQKNAGDTIWLFHRYDTNEWIDGEFHPFYTYIYEYYPESADVKNVIIIEYGQDTTQKVNYYYDDSSRVKSIINQNYTGNATNKWLNYDKIDFFYTISGQDSLYVRYLWNNADSLWEKNMSRGISYYENGLTFVDSTCLWNGSEWIIKDGLKMDYLFNEFGNVYERKMILYNNQWEFDNKTIYFLINDTTGEYDAYYIYAWYNGQWENYERWTEAVVHNWQGYTDYVPNFEHIIQEYWNGNEWIYIRQDSISYDTLGGSVGYYYHWIDNDWKLYKRKINVYNERKLITLFTWEEKIDNQWDTIIAERFSREYIGSIWKEMLYEKYDTALSKWVPAYEYILSDFTYVLNTPDFENPDKSSGFRIIPNPSKTSIQIELNDNTDKIKSVKVYDMAGKSILQRKYNGNGVQERVNISSLTKGVYILNVITKSGKMMKGKFVKN